MSSQYYNELDSEAKSRYSEKLTHKGHSLPDPFDKAIFHHVFSHSMRLWPQITFGDIYMYVVEKECAYTQEKMRNYKALDAYNYVLSGKVGSIAAYRHDALKVCLLTCTVEGGQATKKKHNCWASTGTNGVIFSGHCTCMAGLGEVCSHVAALLFAVQFINERNEPSPTSQSCLWNITRKTVEPVPVAAIDFGHKRKRKKQKFQQSTLPSEEAYKTFFEAVQKHQPGATVLTALTDDEETLTGSQSEVPNSITVPNLIECFREKAYAFRLNAVQHIDTLIEHVTLSEEEIAYIEKATQDQHLSALWKDQRKGRITASLFGRVLKCKTGQKNVVAQIFGKTFSNAAMEWGRQKEVAARRQFRSYLAEHHVNGQFLPCGLLIDRKNIFLGATPDGLVLCDCCETAVVEIKCPAKGKGLKVEDIPKKNFFLNEELNLKRSHIYYDQVQGQMDIWELTKCYFVTYTDIDIHVQVIEFDDEYWCIQKPSLKRFFKQNVLPKILSNESY